MRVRPTLAVNESALRALTPLIWAKQIADVDDAGSKKALARFEQRHQRATLPLYLGTNAIAKLYADNRIAARVVRSAGLRLTNTFKPIKRKIIQRLMTV